MLRWTKDQKKCIAAFVAAFLMAAFCTSFQTGPILHLYEVHNFLYMGLIIAWGFLVYQRILNTETRKYLVLATVFMLLLFVSRITRHCYFEDNVIVSEYAWYAYYVSFSMVPLCAFLAALHVGRREKEPITAFVNLLWIVETLLIICIFTNQWHGSLFTYPEGGKKVVYGPLYYAITVWGMTLTLLSFFIIVKRCRIKAAKKNWFIPGIASLFGLVLIIWYYIVGGSPRLFGVKLYNLQEVFCLTFILPFECMIQLGILPNNSRYVLFFQKSPIRVALLDQMGNEIYESGDYRMSRVGMEENSGKAAGSSEEKMAETFRRSEKELSGGKVVWYEDMTAVLRIGEEIAKVTEELEEENDLILQENEIRAERIGYETKNRLYDKIAAAVKEKTIRINDALTSEELRDQITHEDGRWKDTLVRAMVQGVYVKRMGNLMLIMEENKLISTHELAISIRESLEYFALGGKTQDITEKSEADLPARLILLAYEVFEQVMEQAYDQAYSMAVQSDIRGGKLLRIDLDAGEDFGKLLDLSGKKDELTAFGMETVLTCEDEIWSLYLQGFREEGRV